MDLFLRNGIFAVPVALVATNECTIRMNNLKVILAQLRAATTHFQSISEVRQFGNGGIFCLSSQQLCVQDLLKVPCLPPTRLTESGDQPFLQLIMRVFNVERGWMRYKPSMGFAAPRTISRTIYDI
ncbi:uncharacterized protein LOC142803999 isoform X2 [Rhipicephalus microplus]|uniref:uncharacterized protein LOC142803999 isoform X2 n=1 Tax=Rhipicephalus microplus TaxID=6941 RepID=UPI003F6AD915